MGPWGQNQVCRIGGRALAHSQEGLHHSPGQDPGRKQCVMPALHLTLPVPPGFFLLGVQPNTGVQRSRGSPQGAEA